MKSNIDKALMHCYRELYANSTPPVSFDKLLEEAEVNEDGQKVIDFRAHEISGDLFDEILNETMASYKIKKSMRDIFKRTIYLGCSPKTRTT